MLRTSFLSLAVSGAVLAGCGGDENGDDGGADGGADAHITITDGSVEGGSNSDAGDAAVAHLQSGTYNVSSVVKVTDGCGLTLEDGTFTTLQLSNTGTELSLGKRYDDTTDPKWTPAGYGLGTGPWTTSTTTTLMSSAHVKITDDGCEFDVVRTTHVTFTGNNAVSIDYTDTEQNQTAACKAAAGESTAMCTSHYTFNLTRADNQ